MRSSSTGIVYHLSPAPALERSSIEWTDGHRFRCGKSPTRAFWRNWEHGGECAISAQVWHELVYGVGRLARGKRRGLLEAFLRDVVHPTLPILSYDERAAEWLAEERVRLERAGKHAPVVDGQIAAAAATSGIPLVTANVGDFSIFKGVAVQNWVTGGGPEPKE